MNWDRLCQAHELIGMEKCREQIMRYCGWRGRRDEGVDGLESGVGLGKKL